MLWLRPTTVVILSAALGLAAAADEPEDKSIDPATVELLKTFLEEFILITPGRDGFPAGFSMGRANGGEAERPAHEVQLTKPFRIAKYEVPQNLWEAVMGSNPSRWKGPRNSVEMLSHDEALKFCEKATQLMRRAMLIQPCHVVRLPSEAEWEYCARAGTATLYSFGDDAQQLDDYGWSTQNAAGNDPPVGAKKPNAWKLYDVHGYLWEWCADSWHANYENAPTDGSAWTEGGDPKKRVLRGGSWKDKAAALTSSHRIGADQATRDDAIGLRCVLATERSPKS
jgi:formylglycine-generating enzyme required for sulfatase activity